MLLESLTDGRFFECNGNTFVGRGLPVGLDLELRDISSQHAVIAWHPGQACWLLHDLGSQNGTRLATGAGEERGQRVVPGKPVRLQPGVRVHFAGVGFRVVDVDGPPASAVCLSTGEVRWASDGVLLLPDEQAPERVLVESDAGWLSRPSHGDELDDGDRSGEPLDAAAVVTAGGRQWRLWRPLSTIPTARQAHSALQLAYEVVVSATGDGVRLVLKGSDQPITLPSRRHHELVWLLARARAEDHDRPASERGWRDPEVLLAQMGLRASDIGYISVLIHRLRNQLKARKLSDPDRVVERRDGQLRLGVADVTITDLGRSGE